MLSIQTDSEKETSKNSGQELSLLSGSRVQLTTSQSITANNNISISATKMQKVEWIVEELDAMSSASTDRMHSETLCRWILLLVRGDVSWFDRQIGWQADSRISQPVY